MILNNLSV